MSHLFQDGNDRFASKSILILKTYDIQSIRYDWKSISQHFDGKIKIASQLTIESIVDGSALECISYSNIPFSTQFASIYSLCIQLLQSMNTDNANIQYPWNQIYHQHQDNGLPIVSSNGIYFVKLFFGVEWRSILVDDRVPIFEGKLIFPILSNSNEIWPQLLTKAILKLLILSNRLNGTLSVPLIIQMLTSMVTLDISQSEKLNKSSDSNFVWKSVIHLDGEQNTGLNNTKKPVDLEAISGDDETPWTVTVALNNFVIADDVKSDEKEHDENTKNTENTENTKNSKIPKRWIAVQCAPDLHTHKVQDFWTDETVTRFLNDQTVIVSDNDNAVDILLVIDSLNRNLSEKVTLYLYDQRHNLKKQVYSTVMEHGFTSIIATIEPKKVYFLEIDGDISYSVRSYCASESVYVASRFGDEKSWSITNHKLLEIHRESGQHSVSKTFIAFNVVLTVLKDKCNVLFHGMFPDKLLVNSLVVHCVNLDDHSVFPVPNLNLSRFQLKQNQNGYAVIGFARPSEVEAIPNSKYEIKMLFDGEMEHNIMDMSSVLDFQVDYKQNFEVSVMRDEITSDEGATYLFIEIYFETQRGDDSDEDALCNDFGKIVELIDTETKEVVVSYATTQSAVYIPQIFIDSNSKWSLNVRIDKSNPGSNLVDTNVVSLYKDGSIRCYLRMISDHKIRLFPDNSQQLEFEQIKELNAVICDFWSL